MPAVGCCVQLIHSILCTVLWTKYLVTQAVPARYRAVINARRREMGQKPLTTAQIVDEICDFVANQQAVFLGGHYILQGSRNR